jgi:hypothetical protein
MLVARNLNAMRRVTSVTVRKRPRRVTSTILEESTGGEVEGRRGELADRWKKRAERAQSQRMRVSIIVVHRRKLARSQCVGRQ